MSNNGFHILNSSPWPILSSFSAFGLLLSIALFMHYGFIFTFVVIFFLVAILGCAILWWCSTIKEASSGAHNAVVQRGLSIGMMLFIFSEGMLFFAFFWSFFKSWLDPIYVIDGLQIIKHMSWPPEGIHTLDPWNIPFLNTLILLLSGTSVTWAYHSLLSNNRKGLTRGLGIAVLLGLFFTALQGYEYYHANFIFKEEGVKAIYSSNFYMATGFHGAHVVIGTIFLLFCFFRALKGKYTLENHVGLKCAAWYWQFVDVVWLLLFVFLYVLSS